MCCVMARFKKTPFFLMYKGGIAIQFNMKEYFLKQRERFKMYKEKNKRL